MEHEIIRSWAWSTPSMLPAMLINVFLWAFYFVPALIAWSRKHRSLPAIIAMNILLGWTGIGWIGAFVWSLSWPGHNSHREPFAPATSVSDANPYEKSRLF
jgi:hypothetical protein